MILLLMAMIMPVIMFMTMVAMYMTMTLTKVTMTLTMTMVTMTITMTMVTMKTLRPQKLGEQDGQDYFFASREKMQVGTI